MLIYTEKRRDQMEDSEAVVHNLDTGLTYVCSLMTRPQAEDFWRQLAQGVKFAYLSNSSDALRFLDDLVEAAGAWPGWNGESKGRSRNDGRDSEDG